ncbi:MAG: RagB/SusD family nutrient uptake outer membrane protein, partial [Hymenobacter sp.]
MRSYFTRSLGLLALATGLTALSTSCSKELDQTPNYLASSPDVVYANPTQIFQLLTRIYSTYAVSGQGGENGSSDISGIDGGFSNYIRTYWQLQEITTDEA